LVLAIAVNTKADFFMSVTQEIIVILDNKEIEDRFAFLECNAQKLKKIGKKTLAVEVATTNQ